MNVHSDFDQATNTRSSCSVIDMTGHETITLLYNTVALHADDLTDMNRKLDSGKGLSDYQAKVRGEAVGILEKKLGVPSDGRSPASLAQPVYDEKVDPVRKVKKLPPEQIGGTKRKKATAPATGIESLLAETETAPGLLPSAVFIFPSIKRD